jgi:hypothetical protein
MAKAALKHLRLAPTVAEKDKGKPFLTANIDRAIVMTQYDLRGFSHPLGFRIHHQHPKYLDATIGNFVSFAADAGHDGKKTDEKFVGYFDSSFKDYLAMCKRLVECCDGSEKEAIQLIVGKFIHQHKDMTAKVKVGKMEKTGYLRPMHKNNRMGKAIIALATAFDVDLKTGRVRKDKKVDK